MTVADMNGVTLVFLLAEINNTTGIHLSILAFAPDLKVGPTYRRVDPERGMARHRSPLT